MLHSTLGDISEVGFHCMTGILSYPSPQGSTADYGSVVVNQLFGLLYFDDPCYSGVTIAQNLLGVSFACAYIRRLALS